MSSVQSVARRRLLVSLARDLKSASVRQRLRERSAAAISLDGEELVIVASESLSAVRLRAEPPLSAAEADVVRSQWRIERERVEPVPNFNTSISAQYDYATQYTIATVQVGIPLPVYNKNRGRIQAAQAGYIRASHEVRRRELELRQRLITAINAFQTARNQAFKIEQEVLPLARESLQTTTKTFELGESSYQDLLTAQRTLVQSGLDAIEARRIVFQTFSQIDTYLLSDGLTAARQTPLP